MAPEKWRDSVRLTLTTLAHDARQALCHEDYAEALEVAERALMNMLHSTAREAGPVPERRPQQGTWDFVQSWGGHYRLLDAAGRLVAYVVRAPDGEWKAVFQAGMAPQRQEQEQEEE